MGLIIVILIVFGILWLKANVPIWKLSKGRTPEQKKAIKYAYGGLLVFGKPSHAEYDQLVGKMMDQMNLRQNALQKIGLDEDELKEIPPVFLHGYSGEKKYNNFVFLAKDQKLRSTAYEAIWVFFSNTQVYFYKVLFDICSDEKSIFSEEYFYKDVTNFATSDETVEAYVQGKGEKEKYRKARTLSSFKIVVPGASTLCSTTGVPDADSRISAMKQKLREKKQ